MKSFINVELKRNKLGVTLSSCFMNSASKGGSEQIENGGKGSIFIGTSASVMDVLPSVYFKRLSQLCQVKQSINVKKSKNLMISNFFSFMLLVTNCGSNQLLTGS